MKRRILRVIGQFLLPIQKGYDTGGKTTSSLTEHLERVTGHLPPLS